MLLRLCYPKIALLTVLLSFAALKASGQLTTQFQEESVAESPASQQRMREGTELSQVVGEFQLTGERVTFFSQTGVSMRMLENLALERVIRVLEDTSDKRLWIVDGVVTEFRGSNFLLIKRAVIRRAVE
jgi:hypothetical protein